MVSDHRTFDSERQLKSSTFNNIMESLDKIGVQLHFLECTKKQISTGII